MKGVSVLSEERLTEKTKDCFGYRLKDGSDAEVGFFKDYDAFYSHMMTVKALGEYEDLEEQGLLLRLPCKINQDIYFVPSETNFKLNILNNMPENNRVYHQRICHIVYDGNGYYLECDKELEYGTGRVFIDRHYGEIWFLSESEAEEKLRELNVESEE